MCYYTTNPQTMIQILQVAKDTTNVTKEVVSAIASGHTDLIIEKLIDMCISAGKNILIAIIVYIVGRFLISLIQRVMGNMLSRRKVEISIQTFLKIGICRRSYRYGTLWQLAKFCRRSYHSFLQTL